MHLDERIKKLLPSLANLLMEKKWKLSLAESCSGGGLAAKLTSVSGSSKWFDFSLVTYSNESKIRLLNVSPQLLEQEGAVSEACALAMLNGLGAKQDFQVAITGFAGPEGDEVGLVYIAWQAPHEEPKVEAFHFQGNRQQIVTQVIYQSMRQIILSSMYPLTSSWKCFLAINIEQAHIQKQCLQVGLNLGYTIDELEPFNHLHITIAYLGEKSLTQIHQIKDSLKNQVFSDIDDVHLSVCQFWTRASALVLLVEGMPKFLKDLHDSLSPQTKEIFVPHVTIAKGVKPKALERQLIDITFQVNSFSLMLSYQGLCYLEYQRWNLSK